MNEKEIFTRNIESLALRSLLYEVSASPKPGLVDRNNNGAHNDMDFYTFIDSSSVLGETFYHCTLTGIEHKDSSKTLLKAIRPFGIRGEKKMFAITNNVNTHKGLVFSLGIICAAIGYLYQKKPNRRWHANDICEQVKYMTEGLVERELMNKNFKNPVTYGEKLYIKYGVTGIRGEVTSGFQTVLNHGLPILKELMESRVGTFNDRLVQTLLNLMTHTEDSNILGRHNLDMLKRVQNEAKRIIELGGIFSPEGIKAIKEFDNWCIKHWVSPGGSADLLAVTIMLFLIEKL
ncbi:triphosphoribosyl-dephospho-CoA synthase [Paramaledivibacter caminithermalis DSM 15212]|uniref:Probable 2-(5''-triphosphoribosyl)-3'-dephosphocoenzyme-A synthase n=1 Tax=Paramaledivibacter caminithermalis (strain DSM 15212 / CIP 107654 / DViRD3) TaxID=1121301 RepID=A0A1M6PCE9_PARC5|nr:triphosphoribosyl-dephospho-CoA synthase CitG [Paramaledivibacter caminithermalis]SHK05597.1 triphosphoribosyl-dephospho-CoA synthase [Paramaledivibacter caminithermalis DSM 15212]